MRKNAIIHARINSDIKVRAEKIFDAIGVNASEAINIFFRQVVLKNGIPFKVEIPNKTTLKALKELEGDRLESFENVDELFSKLNKQC